MYTKGTIGAGMAGSGLVGGVLAFTGSGGVVTAVVVGVLAVTIGVLLVVRRHIVGLVAAPGVHGAGNGDHEPGGDVG